MKVAMSAVLDVVQECWCHVFGVAICSGRVRTVDWMDSAILVIGERRVPTLPSKRQPKSIILRHTTAGITQDGGESDGV